MAPVPSVGPPVGPPVMGIDKSTGAKMTAPQDGGAVVSQFRGGGSAAHVGRNAPPQVTGDQTDGSALGLRLVTTPAWRA